MDNTQRPRSARWGRLPVAGGALLLAAVLAGALGYIGGVSGSDLVRGPGGEGPMSATESTGLAVSLPPIDREAPQTFETATFALG
jgi:hypothetical protein